MNGKIWIAIISSVTFMVGIAVASYAVTYGNGGKAKLSLGSKFCYEIQINDADLDYLLNMNKDNVSVKETAKDVYGLQEVDSELIKEISTLNYSDKFSEELRGLRDRFIGPFNAPTINVVVKFNDALEESKAQVCPDSVFYKQRVNIASSDFLNMEPVDQAGIAIVFGCPSPSGEPEPIVISSNLGKRIFQKDELPDSIAAKAKVLPSYVIFN